jgi:orotate phosphoribosyltransferase
MPNPTDYRMRVEEILRDSSVKSIDREIISDILDQSRAIIFDGHFNLINGMHTDTFFRFAQILQYPRFITKISEGIADWYSATYKINIDVVLSTEGPGMVLAYEISSILNKKYKMKSTAMFSDRDPATGKPRNSLSEGFSIKSRKKVLVVNDITTTTTGIATLIALAKSYNAKVIAACVFASRAVEEEKAMLYKKTKIVLAEMIDLKIQQWPKYDCHLCKENMPIIYSRDLQMLTACDMNTPEILSELARNAA